MTLAQSSRTRRSGNCVRRWRSRRGASRRRPIGEPPGGASVERRGRRLPDAADRVVDGVVLPVNDLLCDSRCCKSGWHLREAVATYPKGRFHLGVELFATGRQDEALTQLQQYVAEQPQFVEAIQARTIVGRILLDKRRFAEAIEEFRAVLSMTARTDDAHISATGFLADALFGREQFAEAIRYYQTFVALRPRDVGALTNYGIALANAGHPLEAMQVFQRAVATDPASVNARRNLAKALLNEDRLDAAESETTELLRLKDDDAVGHDLKGRVLASRGELLRARAEFERAVQLDPGDQQAREDLALVLRALGASR